MILTIRWPLFLLVTLVVVIVQATGFDQMQLPGSSRLDLALLLVVGIGFAARPDEAAVQGFVLGLATDLFQFGPFGLHALVFCLVGWSLATLRIRVLEPGASFRTVQAAGAVAMVTALTWFAGGTFGQAAPPANQWPARLILAALCGAVLVHPATRLGSRMLDPADASGEMVRGG